jgi:uncharacterized protein with gpF-like domain
MARKPAFISHSREREVQVQKNLQAALEGRFRRVIAGEIERERHRLASAYRESGSMPPQDDGHRQRMRGVYYDMDHASIRTFGARVLTQGKALGLTLETKQTFAEIFEAMAIAFINSEAIRRRITSVTDTTRADIVSAIQLGQESGLSLDEISAMIVSETPLRSRMRASIIARTEIHAASNYGAQESAKRTGLSLKKEWVAVEDARTRDFGEADGIVDQFSHRAMDGQTVEMDGKFRMPQKNGTFVLCDYPGDPTLPAAGAINCRCQIAHVVDDDF